MRKVRSFVRREGRLTASQQKALENNWDRYGLAVNDGLVNLDTLFAKKASTVLEIGFGMGQSLLAMAEQNPEKNYIGVEVHRPGVGTILREIELRELNNVRVYAEDAIEVLNHCIPDHSLSGVQLFFPDPWPKKRHHKRRIVQPEFVHLIKSKLVENGFFHMATDWQNYAEHMMAVLTEAEGFTNKYGAGNYASSAEARPETKFERRGLKLGHGVWDLVFLRCE